MLKMKKRILLAVFAILLILSTTCLAATTSSKDAKLEIVENNICTIKINDFASFEKKIVDYNLEKKEITLGLTIKNDAKVIENPPFEVVLVIDNSKSMIENKVTTTTTRLETVASSAKKLTNQLMANENMKIAVVSFSTGDNEGTLSDARLRTKLTSNKETVLSSIDQIATDDTQGPRTNIDAGLQVAKTCFSKENNNKYVILLTDGNPNTAVGGPTFTYSGETATKTKATLKNLEKEGINVISAMIGLDEVRTETTTNLTYKQLSEEVFGTNTNPTVGKFYYVSDKDIEKSICETIFSDIVDTTLNTLTDVYIYDYFPQEIIDNFDFAYVTSPNLGSVSASIDLQNNCIVWHIDKLEPQTSGFLSYKLTLKGTINENILIVVLNTNKKVDITAKELEKAVTSNVSPKIRVVKDVSVAPTTIPQTGTTSTLFISIVVVVIIGAILGTRFYLLNRDIK